MIQTIIYAYDPMKLDLHLRSREKMFIGPKGPVSVICHPRSLAEFNLYSEVVEPYDQVNVVQFGNSDSITQYLRPHIKYTQILCDDVIWTKPFVLHEFIQKLNDKETIMACPRLGKHNLGNGVNKINYRSQPYSITSYGDIWHTDDLIKYQTSEEKHLNDPGLHTGKYHIQYDDDPYLVANTTEIEGSIGLFKEGKRINITPWLFSTHNSEEVEIPYVYEWAK